MYYFKLTYKKSGDTAFLEDVDRDVCHLLGKKYDPHKWCYIGETRVEGVDWYNLIGQLLAIGYSLDQIAYAFEHNQEICKIVNYLNETFEVVSWYEP